MEFTTAPSPIKPQSIASSLNYRAHAQLSILEEAAFVTELKNTRQMAVAQIASELSRSKAWVNVRLGLLIGMSEQVRQKLFAGAFPVYAYMNQLRHCMRITGVTQAQVDAFVLALSGHGLSVREVTQLAHGCFRGPESLRQEILKGHFTLPLQQMQAAARSCPECSDFERYPARGFGADAEVHAAGDGQRPGPTA